MNLDGKEIEIPTLVPTLTQEEVNHLLSGKAPTKDIMNKAVNHAIERMKQGKNPFAEEGEEMSTKDKWRTR